MTVGLGARGSDKVMAVTVAAAQDLTQRADVLHSPISYSTTPKKSRAHLQRAATAPTGVMARSQGYW